jgi:ATP citrate (pro-S)-lyase
LDEATGASLKFTVLNPKGRVWLMVAGGGASVIYTDTVADLGYAQVGGAPGTEVGPVANLCEHKLLVYVQ